MMDIEKPGTPTGEPEADDACDLDPTKQCDNCMKCLFEADFNAITISGIELENEHEEQDQ